MTYINFREVIQKHVQFEYKAVRREKNVADFQQYITYKADFLKLVRIRMKVLHMMSIFSSNLSNRMLLPK